MNMTFANVLRYSLPGGVFIGAALLFYPDSRKVLGNNLEGFFDAAVLFAIALLVGTLIQAAHRSVIYVWILRAILYQINKEKLTLDHLLPWKVRERELDDYEEMLQFQIDDAKSYEWFRRWADQTHFLWASLWAVVLARLLPSHFGFTLSPDYAHFFLPLGTALFILAATDDLRHTIFEFRLRKIFLRKAAERRKETRFHKLRHPWAKWRMSE